VVRKRINQNYFSNKFLDTPSSSFETPIDRGRDTPKTMKDDKLDHDGLSSKRGDHDDDDEDFDKQSVTSTSTTRSKEIYFK
jgi:hypothetical protein